MDDPKVGEPDGGVAFEGDPGQFEPADEVTDDIAMTEATHAEVGDVRETVPVKGRRMIFTIASIALLMASIDSTIVATALHTIEHGLHSGVNWVVWTITIYSLGQIVVMPLAGKLSDQFGRKRIFVAAIVLFTVASLLCGLSTSIYMLIPLRLLQSIGGGAFLPSASGIVADQFGADRDRALGMFTSIFPIGGIIGPAIGGPITQYFGWRAIFFVNVPVGIVLYILAKRHLPASTPRARTPVDVRGLLMLTTTIILAMTAISFIGEEGATIYDPKFLVPLCAAALAGWAFVHHTRTAEAPFIPVRLLAGKGFATMHMINFIFGAGAFGLAALVPLYASDRYGITPATAGTILSARAIGIIVVASSAVFLLRRTGYRLPMYIGAFTMAVGVLALSFGPRGLSAFWWLSVWSLLTGVGMGIAIPATNNASLHLAPDDVAAIAGLRGMFRQSGGIVYISIVSALIARSSHPGLEQAHIFWVQTGIFFVLMALVPLVPEHRGSW